MIRLPQGPLLSCLPSYLSQDMANSWFLFNWLCGSGKGSGAISSTLGFDTPSSHLYSVPIPCLVQAGDMTCVPFRSRFPLHWETPDNLEVLLFPLAPPSDSSYLFLLLTSVQRIFTSARVGKTQSCTSMYFFFKFIDDRNTWVPQTCGNCSF